MGVPIVRIPVAGAMTATRRVRAMRAAFYTAHPGQPRWLFGIARLVDGRAVWDGPYGPEPSLFDVRWDPLERRPIHPDQGVEFLEGLTHVYRMPHFWAEIDRVITVVEP
jgi:hypothetical protein